MSNKLFGTDGIRGTANQDLTADIALKVGMAAGLHFTRGDHRHRVVIGKDTRLSGYMIEPALTAGFVAAGMDPILVGPMPTPAIAMLTKSLRADLGVMISASHNPYQDNGIKLFDPDGHKLSDEVQHEIEARMDGNMTPDLAPPAELGRALRLDDALGRYIEFAKQTFPRGETLEGLKVVIDCANGAAYKAAPTVLWELGAEVVPVGVSPDGMNINKNCGSTHPEFLCDQVQSHGADIGIGDLIDGDQIMAAIASSLKEEGRLTGDCVVATVMSNLGLELYLKSESLELIRTQVGDRYVVEAMRDGNCNLGGEQSGHIVLSDFGTTGDGLVAALQVLALLKKKGGSAKDVCRPFEPLPQVLKNVRYNGVDPLDSGAVKSAIKDAESLLAGAGRLLIRKSGTEPLVRVMAEGEDGGLVLSVVDGLVGEIEKAVAAA